MFLSWLKRVFPWFDGADATYIGFVNGRELIYVILVSLLTGGFSNLGADLLANISRIIVNPEFVGVVTGVITAVIALINRLRTGWNIPVKPMPESPNVQAK